MAAPLLGFLRYNWYPASILPGDSLTYAWTLTDKPSGSSATLGSTSSTTTMLAPDVLGSYTVELSVNDGNKTATDTVEVTAANQAPTAEAGSDKSSARGQSVTLDGTGSSDPDTSDSLSYSWSLTSKPSGSSATLGSSSGSSTTLTPDVLGDYIVELTVDDQSGASNATAT
ncbi:MAG: PKD domain-containing protein, partial [Bradymonadaceae bacterium]